MLEASGASIVNAGLTSVDSGGPFAQPLVVGTTLVGEGATTGYGGFLMSTAATFEACRLEGDSHGLSSSVNGVSWVLHSMVITQGLSPVYEQSGAAVIQSMSTLFTGGTPSGAPSSFKYVHCAKPNFDPVVDGTGSALD